MLPRRKSSREGGSIRAELFVARKKNRARKRGEGKKVSATRCEGGKQSSVFRDGKKGRKTVSTVVKKGHIMEASCWEGASSSERKNARVFRYLSMHEERAGRESVGGGALWGKRAYPNLSGAST